MKLEWLDRLTKVRKCAVCGEILAWSPSPGAFCPDCLPKWEFSKVESCPLCFRSALECRCMPRLLSDSGALSLRKLFFYHPDRSGSVSNRLIYFVKRKRNKRVFRFLAKELWSRLQEEWKENGMEPEGEKLLLCGIPRSWSARSTYGFDQSDCLCRAISKESGILYLPLIRRRFGSAQQKTLSRAQRLKNMKKRLLLKPNVLKKAEVDLSEYTVILVDDVVTTGATMASAVTLLHRAGVRQIFCLSLASRP